MKLKSEFIEKDLASNFYKHFVEYFNLHNYKSICCYDSTACFNTDAITENFVSQFKDFMNLNSRLIINSFQPHSRSLGAIKYTGFYLLCPNNFEGGSIFILDNEWSEEDITCPAKKLEIEHNQFINFEQEQLTLMEYIEASDSPLIYISISNYED